MTSSRRSHHALPALRGMLLALLLCTSLAVVACEEDADAHSDVRGYDEAALLEAREAKDDLFRTSDESPIPEDKRASFAGLSFYDPNPDYAVNASVQWHQPADTIIIGTSVGGDDRRAVRAATFLFALNGRSSKLVGYQLLDVSTPYEGQLFVPFRDGTNGYTTYEAGRYLDVPIEAGEDSVVIDFNTAYHPLCLFNHAYSCPLPPPENTLRYKVEAGEKK